MKQNTLSAEGFESTYALLVRSEEKERCLFEGVAYLILILSAIFSIWYVAQQPFALSRTAGVHNTTVTQSVDTQQRA